jgi:hypothetical protein
MVVAQAASTLAQWVAARDRALGEPVMSDTIARSVEGRVRQELVDIARPGMSVSRH